MFAYAFNTRTQLRWLGGVPDWAVSASVAVGAAAWAWRGRQPGSTETEDASKVSAPSG